MRLYLRAKFRTLNIIAAISKPAAFPNDDRAGDSHAAKGTGLSSARALDIARC
jgi:hypothetical protein